MTIYGMVDLWKELREMESKTPMPYRLSLRDTRMALFRMMKEKVGRGYIRQRPR